MINTLLITRIQEMITEIIVTFLLCVIALNQCNQRSPNFFRNLRSLLSGHFQEISRWFLKYL